MALWTTPVDEEFRHSSLVYHLDRRVRTVTATDAPRVGSFVVYFGDERMYDPDYRLPFETTLLASEERRGVEFRPLRVR